jgi:putative peptidoglycan lipid II flippase
LLFLLRLIKMGISILTLSLSAKYFGVSIERDVWLLALNCIVVLDLAIWGPLNETFRAKFIFFREEFGEKEALIKTNALLLLTNIVTVILVTVILIWPQYIAAIIAPSYTGEKLSLLMFMIRVVAPSFLINQCTQIFISILNAYHSIYVPEIAGFFSGIVSLILVVLLAPIVGIFALAYAYYFSMLLLLVLLIIQLRARKINLFSNIDKIRLKDSKPFLLFALPFFFPYFIGQIALIVEKSIASSMGAGTVSVIDYSRKFSDILLNVLSSVLSTMMIPVISLKFAQGDKKGFVTEFKQVYQLGFLLIICITTMFTACPEAFVNILYKKGSINAESLLNITQLTMLYSWAAVAIYLYTVIGMALLSSNNGKIYAFYGIIAQGLMIICNLSLYRLWGSDVFPISLFAAHLISAAFMFQKLPYDKGKLLMVTLKYILTLFIIVFTMYFFNRYILILVWPYAIVLLNAATLGVLLILLLFAFQLDERLIISKAYHKLVGKHL